MFELVYSPTKYQRVYKFKTPLIFIPRPFDTARHYWEYVSKKYKIEPIKTDTLDFVCIFDMINISHIERLVFPATKCKKTNEWIITFDDIAGKHLWMGDEIEIFEDKLYLNYLIGFDKRINGD